MNAPPSRPWPGCSLVAVFGARAASAGRPAETLSGVCSPARLLKALCPLAPAASLPLQVPPTKQQTKPWQPPQTKTENPLLHIVTTCGFLVKVRAFK